MIKSAPFNYFPFAYFLTILYFNVTGTKFLCSNFSPYKISSNNWFVFGNAIPTFFSCFYAILITMPYYFLIFLIVCIPSSSFYVLLLALLPCAIFQYCDDTNWRIANSKIFIQDSSNVAVAPPLLQLAIADAGLC